jgi:hypothetical protein
MIYFTAKPKLHKSRNKADPKKSPFKIAEDLKVGFRRGCAATFSSVTVVNLLIGFSTDIDVSLVAGD